MNTNNSTALCLLWTHANTSGKENEAAPVNEVYSVKGVHTELISKHVYSNMILTCLITDAFASLFPIPPVLIACLTSGYEEFTIKLIYVKILLESVKN